MVHGQQIVFERQGDQSPEKPPGDLVVTLHQLPHPVFSREGNNLYIKQQLNLEEALLGFRKVVNHLDGREVVLQRDKVTQPGFVDTIVGQGMPLNNFPSEKGSLFVEYSVFLPPTITETQRECKSFSLVPIVPYWTLTFPLFLFLFFFFFPFLSFPLLFLPVVRKMFA